MPTTRKGKPKTFTIVVTEEELDTLKGQSAQTALVVAQRLEAAHPGSAEALFYAGRVRALAALMRKLDQPALADHSQDPEDEDEDDA